MTKVSKEATQLADALIAALKALQQLVCPDCYGVNETNEDGAGYCPTCKLGAAIEKEIICGWTCDECGQADTTVAWSVRFDSSLCASFEDFAL